MVLKDTITTFLVLGGLFLLAYMRFTGKTLVDVFKEIRDIFSSETEVVDNPY